jgi:hypothetical protein
VLDVIHNGEYLENVGLVELKRKDSLGSHAFEADILTVHCEIVLDRPAVIIIRT